MTKIKKIYINDAECLMPSVFTQSKIFLVIPENYPDLKKESVPMIIGQRTKTETYSYSGYKLDLIKDYPLFHIMLREKQHQKTNDVKINLNAVLKELGIQVKPENRFKLFNRIWEFRLCSISVTNEGDGKFKLPKKRTALINTMTTVDEKYVIVHFCDDMDLIVDSLDTQIIDLAEYRKLKKQSAMAIYLSIKSHGFIKSKHNIINLTLKVLRVHYEVTRTDEQVIVELDKGFKKLISLGFIKSYKQSKTKKTEETTYEIKLE